MKKFQDGFICLNLWVPCIIFEKAIVLPTMNYTIKKDCGFLYKFVYVENLFLLYSSIAKRVLPHFDGITWKITGYCG